MEPEAVVVMRRHALILATANYDDPAFRPLPSVHADSWYLRQVLEDSAIGGFEQVQVVKDASVSEMQAATVNFLSSRSPDELALLYISGHGAWSREAGQLYFVAASSRSDCLPGDGHGRGARQRAIGGVPGRLQGCHPRLLLQRLVRPGFSHSGAVGSAT
jgi:hypothetical protein